MRKWTARKGGKEQLSQVLQCRSHTHEAPSLSHTRTLLLNKFFCIITRQSGAFFAFFCDTLLFGRICLSKGSPLLLDVIMPATATAIHPPPFVFFCPKYNALIAASAIPITRRRRHHGGPHRRRYPCIDVPKRSRPLRTFRWASRAPTSEQTPETVLFLALWVGGFRAGAMML